MTFLILMAFAYSQNKGSRKANLTKSIMLIKGSHLFTWALSLQSFLQVSSRICLQRAVLLSYKV